MCVKEPETAMGEYNAQSLNMVKEEHVNSTCKVTFHHYCTPSGSRTYVWLCSTGHSLHLNKLQPDTNTQWEVKLSTYQESVMLKNVSYLANWTSKPVRTASFHDLFKSLITSITNSNFISSYIMRRKMMDVCLHRRDLCVVASIGNVMCHASQHSTPPSTLL